MRTTTRVDFHCHSSYSDGSLSPAQIAERLSEAGVAFASLTDHDTTDGLSGFRKALARRGIGFITGIEITVDYSGREVHLLAYGFDQFNPELQETLRAVRRAKTPAVQGITQSIRQQGVYHPAQQPVKQSVVLSEGGKLDVDDAISLIHRAGGCAFLAHPMDLHLDFDQLEELLVYLKNKGLDGIEAYHGMCDSDNCEKLAEMASRLNLLVCGGGDLHSEGVNGVGRVGIDMPTHLWKEFRDAVTSKVNYSCDHRFSEKVPQISGRVNWRPFIFHIIFPTAIVIILFVSVIFAVLIPGFERSLLDKKREMIRELTNSAWSILAESYQEEKSGRISREQAQMLARTRIEYMRYGPDRKDYFWLQDMHPRIIMHPYRKDLNGVDVSGFRDPRGVAIFVEFAELVRRKKEGYIQYVWQWKDDPSRLEPKESYVKGFEPWGWVVGTGLYIEDVEEEIARIERRLVQSSLLISFVVAVLLLYVMKQSLRLETERSEAEKSLRESRERYRSLVEASSEGALLVLNGRCRYANPPLLKMLGYSRDEIDLLELSDILPDNEDNQKAWENVERLFAGNEVEGGFSALLRKSDRSEVECVLTLSRISFERQNGIILLARQVDPTGSPSGEDDESRPEFISRLGVAAENLSSGVFRFSLSGSGRLLVANTAALSILQIEDKHEGVRPALSSIIPNRQDYEEFIRQIQTDGCADILLRIPTSDGKIRSVLLNAKAVQDEDGVPIQADVIVQDVSEQEKQAAEQQTLMERMQTSLMFLHESISHSLRSPLSFSLDTPIRIVVDMMSSHNSSAVLVHTDAGSCVGIVTDCDLRNRVVAVDYSLDEPVSRIMTSPLITISEDARIYEALMIMEEKAVQHLAVEDDSGKIIGLVEIKDLVQFHNYGSAVLTMEIAEAADASEIARLCKRTPPLVRTLLGCGARPRNVNRMITAISDAAARRLIDLAIKELGPPPVGFVFIAMGSHGRQEMTLSSDQDNAIIFDNPEEDVNPEDVYTYFKALAEQVCHGLDFAGYPSCAGNIMASNPKWCKPLEVWKEYFRTWIHKSEPQELLDLSIFFDFRPVYGFDDLAYDLRHYIHLCLKSSPAFFTHFANNSLLFKPPLRLLGTYIGGGESAGYLNLKDAMMPIVNSARLYSLKNEVDETHTLLRLEALGKIEALPESTVEEIVIAYDFLMNLRLNHQSGAIQAGQIPDNTISYRRLGNIDQALLQQSLAQIVAVQKRISFDFLGGN